MRYRALKFAPLLPLSILGSPLEQVPRPRESTAPCLLGRAGAEPATADYSSEDFTTEAYDGLAKGAADPDLASGSNWSSETDSDHIDNIIKWLDTNRAVLVDLSPWEKANLTNWARALAYFSEIAATGSFDTGGRSLRGDDILSFYSAIDQATDGDFGERSFERGDGSSSGMESSAFDSGGTSSESLAMSSEIGTQPGSALSSTGATSNPASSGPPTPNTNQISPSSQRTTVVVTQTLITTVPESGTSSVHGVGHYHTSTLTVGPTTSEKHERSGTSIALSPGSSSFVALSSFSRNTKLFPGTSSSSFRPGETAAGTSTITTTVSGTGSDGPATMTVTSTLFPKSSSGPESSSTRSFSRVDFDLIRTAMTSDTVVSDTTRVRGATVVTRTVPVKFSQVGGAHAPAVTDGLTGSVSTKIYFAPSTASERGQVVSSSGTTVTLTVTDDRPSSIKHPPSSSSTASDDISTPQTSTHTSLEDATISTGTSTASTAVTSSDRASSTLKQGRVLGPAAKDHEISSTSTSSRPTTTSRTSSTTSVKPSLRHDRLRGSLKHNLNPSQGAHGAATTMLSDNQPADTTKEASTMQKSLEPLTNDSHAGGTGIHSFVAPVNRIAVPETKVPTSSSTLTSATTSLVMEGATSYAITAMNGNVPSEKGLHLNTTGSIPMVSTLEAKPWATVTPVATTGSWSARTNNSTAFTSAITDDTTISRPSNITMQSIADSLTSTQKASTSYASTTSTDHLSSSSDTSRTTSTTTSRPSSLTPKITTSSLGSTDSEIISRATLSIPAVYSTFVTGTSFSTMSATNSSTPSTTIRRDRKPTAVIKGVSDLSTSHLRASGTPRTTLTADFTGHNLNGTRSGTTTGQESKA
ncbi:hypothetical protein TWF696_007472 [Orbilia brochopaga]|uniref:Uncharacterized protein n=1 Tax=Orbilia brochopaga TaxID=3140254 RepID=A0AAV9UK77_9PEZI